MRESRVPPRYIVVEGPIGVGKTSLADRLSERLGAKVAIQHGRGGRGKLVIGYHGLETLDGILDKLRGGAA